MGTEYETEGAPAGRLADGGKRGEESSLIPNSFQVPNAYVDRLMALLTPEEFKVLVYMDRRILGFGKRRDRISIRQLTCGVTNREGVQLDYGTGMGEQANRTACHSLVGFRVVVQTSENDPHKNEGPEFGLQLNDARIDWTGLENRRRLEDEKRGGRMRQIRTQRGGGVVRQDGVYPLLSNKTGGGVVQQDGPRLVQQDTQNPVETKGNQDVPTTSTNPHPLGSREHRLWEWEHGEGFPNQPGFADPTSRVNAEVPSSAPVTERAKQAEVTASPREASNRRAEPDPREELPPHVEDERKPATGRGKVLEDAIWIYCDEQGRQSWQTRLEKCWERALTEGASELELTGLLLRAAEVGRKRWEQNNTGRPKNPWPLYDAFADEIAAARKKRRKTQAETSRPAAREEQQSEPDPNWFIKQVDAGPGSETWEQVTSPTMRHLLQVNYQKRHPEAWAAHLEQQYALEQSQAVQQAGAMA